MATTSRAPASSHGVPGIANACPSGRSTPPRPWEASTRARSQAPSSTSAAKAISASSASATWRTSERRKAVPTDAAVPAAIVRSSSGPEGREVAEEGSDVTTGSGSHASPARRAPPGAGGALRRTQRAAKEARHGAAADAEALGDVIAVVPLAAQREGLALARVGLRGDGLEVVEHLLDGHAAGLGHLHGRGA